MGNGSTLVGLNMWQPLLAIVWWVLSALPLVPCLAYAAGWTVLLRMPQSSFSRRVRVTFAAGSLLLGLRWARRRAEEITDDEEREAFWDIRMRGYARFAYEHIAQLKGFWCKVGQYLSSRADILPRPFVRELGKVQDSMPSTAMEDVRRIVESETGVSLE